MTFTIDHVFVSSVGTSYHIENLLSWEKPVGSEYSTLHSKWRDWFMVIRNEFVEREWLLRHLGHTIGTHNVDHIINFARDAGYLDTDGCVTVLGKNFYRVASRDPDALGYDKNYVMQHYH